MRSSTNHFCECGKRKTRNRIKLRAMTAEEFCLSHHCKDCPENMPFNSWCSLDIICTISKKKPFEIPYQDKNGRYILVRADD